MIVSKEKCPVLHAPPISAASSGWAAVSGWLTIIPSLRAIAARFVPATGRSCDCDRCVAASRIGRISCGDTWNCFGDVVRRINRGLTRRRSRTGRRGAACRHSLVACCGFGACDCAVLAWLVDYAGDCGARESFGGVLGVSTAASWGGEGCSGKGFCSVLGYSCSDAGCCAHERWSLLCNERSVDARVVEAGSSQEAYEGSTWKCLSDGGCTWLRHWTNGERTGRDS